MPMEIMRSKNDYWDYLEQSVIIHFNPNHDALGRFASGGGLGAANGVKTTKTKSGSQSSNRTLLAQDKKKEDATISTKTASIEFKPDPNFGYKGRTLFGGNPKCLITIEYPEDKKILDRIITNEKLEKKMREHASEMYQYESINPNHETKEKFRSKLKCDQITIGHTYNADIVDIWYSHPDDSGAWYMQVNTTNNVIEDEQYYR